jgi:hypothetical protein
MNNEIHDEKLRKNAVRTTGASTLHKIRMVVDSFDSQDKKKKISINSCSNIYINHHIADLSFFYS